YAWSTSKLIRWRACSSENPAASRRKPADLSAARSRKPLNRLSAVETSYDAAYQPACEACSEVPERNVVPCAESAYAPVLAAGRKAPYAASTRAPLTLRLSLAASTSVESWRARSRLDCSVRRTESVPGLGDCARSAPAEAANAISVRHAALTIVSRIRGAIDAKARLLPDARARHPRAHLRR